ncbi:sensor histidine kinase [Actinocorallia longicatena]|uniref:histidine kinase n=1 Tax=Actinocorallia longicatena TaxID=111803 RepID=A0ABP6QL62_9ACTN
MSGWIERRRRGGGPPPIAVDAMLAVGCFLSIVITAVIDECFAWWVVPLALGNVVPLLWRRRHPLAVTFVIGVGTTVLSLLDVIGKVPAAQLVATYTFAALSPPHRRAVGVAGTVVGLTLSIIPHEELLNLGPNALFFVAAYALGTSARARSDRITLLEERALRHREEADAAAVRERERIAREMHDIIAHAMSLVVVQAEAGPVRLRKEPGRAEAVFDEISASAREALAQLRRALSVLRSEEAERRPQPGLDGLPSLIESVGRTGIDASLHEDGERRALADDTATTVYRIVQEALTNTLRHAAADRVEVRLDWRAEGLCLEISDDGEGPSGDGRAGRGLAGMRERVAAAGGDLTFGPVSDGRGFRIAARLP